ncbi:Arabinose 5-phosphate isomerase [Nitrincola lacisaponensis]|uniref:Arabinose 5-phosphate isomerase n=2 Tax=Nitrincola lacisaponensis TaxID=267850 RepID=A0A063Y527_9GAMM|nr:Arabinose 5-phosphate isomerase [Nitrincola lacisaponensis]
MNEFFILYSWLIPIRMSTFNFLAAGLRTIEIEQATLSALLNQLNSSFSEACQLLLSCEGRVIVTGMGKSGHIGNKIAATLASTGTPAFFVHPGEASHGDLGMFTGKDVVLALSNSGETAEVITILPLIKRMGAPLISMTSNPESTLSRFADINLHLPVEREACPHNLAPTSSTTAQLVMGDALAIALLEARGFSPEDFAFSHPGGSLGRQLLLRVDDIMHSGEDIPQVSLHTPIHEALLEVTQKRLGMTAVTNDQGELLGIFTDGDLRRTLDLSIDLKNTPIAEVMTPGGTTLKTGSLAAEALKIMQERKINALLITDADGKLAGALNMHDLLKAGVI